jgi:hypothetical protein
MAASERRAGAADGLGRGGAVVVVVEVVVMVKLLGHLGRCVPYWAGSSLAEIGAAPRQEINHLGAGYPAAPPVTIAAVGAMAALILCNKTALGVAWFVAWFFGGCCVGVASGVAR